MPSKYNPLLAAIGEKIVNRREELGMTATELAIQADITPSSLSLYESGQRVMGVNKLHRIAAALKVPLSYFQADELDRFSDYSSEMMSLMEQLRDLPLDKQRMMIKMFSAQIATL